MVYKNFLLRLLSSFIFVTIYLFVSYIDFNLVFYLIVFIYLGVFIEIFLNFKRYKIIPLLYIFLSFIFFILINFNNLTFLNFNLFIFTVISFDIFSYIFGKSFGNTKLIKISPNKTIEGLLGGIFITLALSISLAYFNNIIINIQFVCLIVFIIFFAFIGDIIESYFKRKNNLKNSSELIPGHGGIFDRFDSFLFSIILYSVFLNF